MCRIPENRQSEINWSIAEYQNGRWVHCMRKTFTMKRLEVSQLTTFM